MVMNSKRFDVDSAFDLIKVQLNASLIMSLGRLIGLELTSVRVFIHLLVNKLDSLVPLIIRLGSISLGLGFSAR